MVTSYAAPTDLAAWTGAGTPANAVQLLRSASIVIRDTTATAFYAADSSGLPTDAVTLQAFKDATCAQAAAMGALNVDPLAGGVLTAGVKSSKKIGSASVTYSDADAAAAAKAKALTAIVPEAMNILQQAGIILNSVWHVG